MNQQTLAQPFQLEGKGLHTGAAVSVAVHPLKANQGILFRRTDLEKPINLRADADLVVPSQRSTVLAQGNVQLATIEHFMAAAYATGLDNALVEVNGPELPILDGSALPWLQAIEAAGLVEQDSPKEYLIIEQPITINDEQTGASISIIPSEAPGLDLSVMIDFKDGMLGQQFARLNDMAEFKTAIAPSRTFVFLHELKALIQAGLVKGGDLDNALVLVDQLPPAEEVEALRQFFNKPNLQLQQGVLSEQPLAFANEPARHKLLDVLGDLFLAGARIQGKVVAYKPGHNLNNKAARALKQALAQQKRLQGLPKYLPSQKPVYDINQITQRLQHRFPFLLIDKIIEISDKHIVGVKNVTMNEPFFPGHFPGNPVMPGVLQIEALAQTGGIFVMHNIEDPQNWDTYFLRISEARFRTKVIPGDTLLLHLELISPVRRGLCEMRGKIYVGETLVTEAELLAQIIKRPTA
jgi:UDP-3-O-[3-hydroxymyristoyl] N-acetylglucosamine deacetylase/3-hydroxyacyl-[acyl-carrier-protein] dehydratase